MTENKSRVHSADPKNSARCITREATGCQAEENLWPNQEEVADYHYIFLLPKHGIYFSLISGFLYFR